MENERKEIQERSFVGTLVGEITSKEFRLAVAHETIREQDIIAVDATLNQTGDSGQLEALRVWAKVQRIERINPLFPAEAGHELAETRTDPMETVLSLSRELVSAVCQVLGSEPLESDGSGKLDSLRYPPKPATSAYRPDSENLARVLVGNLENNQDSAMDIATLSNSPAINVKVDGHALVTRHLAILAMTGSGKSWAARKIIEELANKDYPMVVFDPHGDYTGLADIERLNDRVNRYYATLPIFEQEADTVAQIVNNLGYDLSPTMEALFGDLFDATQKFYDVEEDERIERRDWLADRLGDRIRQYGIHPDLWLIANIADATARSIRNARNEEPEDFQYLEQICWQNLPQSTDPRTLEGIYKRTRKAATQLRMMERINREIAHSAQPMPLDRAELVQDGKISIVSLAGYTGDFQATIYSIIANELFNAKVTKRLKWPFLLLLEEAHNFVPSRGNSSAEQQSIAITKQIAQEGRKFGVGLVVISQRPSRLDETALSQCNSYIIMRMVNPADQNFVRRVIESLGEEEVRLLPDLDVGEALLSGQMVNFPVLVRMKPPESQGEREETNAFKHLKQVRFEIGSG